MRLAGVSVVRNECDIIESFVRTNLVLLDAMYVTLHRSTDGTADILRALAREGLPLKLAEAQQEAFAQEQHTLAMARAAFAEGADFVFPLDADEFVLSADRATIERSLAALPDGQAGALPWLNYVPSPLDRPGPPLQRLERRFPFVATDEVNLDYYKCVFGRWFAGRTDVRLNEGNHVVFVGGQLATTPVGGVALCHFPIRSPDQLARKATIGWLAQLASRADFEQTGWSSHWKRIFTSLKANGSLSDADVRAFVEGYVAPASRGRELVLDPLRHRVTEERYAHLQRPQSLLQALLEAAEAFAKAAAPRG